MNDRLLRELGDLARSESTAEEARFDDRWDRLAAGTLTAEEEAELKALAESSPENQEAYEAFRPLGAEFQARVVSAIQSEQAERAAEERQPKPQETRPRVLPFRPLIRRVELWVGSAAAVAAGVFFMVRPPMLGGYGAELEGGFRKERGGETATPNEKRVFTPGAPFRLEVKPKQSLEHPGAVKASAYLTTSAGREDLKPLGLENKFQSSETGSVRLDATMGEDIKVPPGDWILWTVVARKSLPEAVDVQTRLRANQPQDTSWRNICDALHKEESPPPPPSPWQVTCADFREGQPDP